MLANLVAEMARNKILRSDIAETLGVKLETVSNWICERTSIRVDDGFTIQEVFFPSMTVDYLFKSDKKNYEAS